MIGPGPVCHGMNGSGVCDAANRERKPRAPRDARERRRSAERVRGDR